MAEEYQGHRNLIIVSFCCLKILDILNLSTSQTNIFFFQPKTLVTHVDSSNSYFYNKVTRFMLPVKIKVVSKIYMVCFFLRALCHLHRSQFPQLSEVAQSDTTKGVSKIWDLSLPVDAADSPFKSMSHTVHYSYINFASEN